MRPIRHVDVWVLLGMLLFALLVQQGRIGASINGVDLTTDPAMYASIAAAYGHPADFARDFVFGAASQFSTHVTPLVQLVHWLSGDDGNYGVAYLELTGLVVFLHYAAFYLLGAMFFGQRWKALIFTVLMGLCYWTPWGTYWGAGYRDYTPRTLFEALYALFLCANFAVLRRPRWWPVFMAALGGLVYVHSISALPAAAGLWLGFAASRPQGWSRVRHLGWLLLSGGCFLATMAPYAAIYLHSSGVSLSAEDVAFMDHILRTRFDIEYAEYLYGMGKFLRRYTLLPVIPLALWGTWMIVKYGSPRQKLFGRHIWLWIAGVYVVIALFVLDQEISRALGRMHLEFDLVRVHRFLPFFAICLIFLGADILWQRVSRPGWQRVAARLFCLGLVIGFFCGGQQDMARTSLAWYWNRLDEARYAAAYGPQLHRAEMVAALSRYTRPHETIFFPGKDQAIRYNALRSLTYGWKDACLLYYAKGLERLRQWESVEAALKTSPTAYIEVGLATSPDYILSERPQDRAELEARVGPVIWENARYLLVKNTRGRPAS
ncbi:hypothetical protein [uncultured Desulfovibrio sp.]|uniref:hypothetical protein n=1 Tax=uncultured Desulfovibrio sp. TaxID=167968 RepID=UPI002625DA85|nr:hypothetical protein [uncultured Desulfovibrio sp.]